MIKGNLSRLAVGSSLALALAMVSCKPGASGHANSAGSATPTTGKLAGALAAEGDRAIAGGDAVAAVGLSEKAVAFAPKNAGYRVELGRAYMMAGRFGSAAQSFQDARDLGRDDGQLLLNLALAETALGDAAAAQGALADAGGRVADGDRGLALALAGDTAAAVPLLEAAARAPGASATVRQNLALAYALAGRWADARTTAAQDVSPAELDGRMAQWAALAGATAPAQRIAGLFSLPAVSADPGLPTALALVHDRHEPVRTAAADVAPAEPAPPSSAADEPRVPTIDPGVQAAVPPMAETAPAPGAVVSPAFVAPSPSAQPAAPLLRAQPRPARVRVAAAGALLRAAPMPQARGSWVVQLGAFSSVRHAETAWARTQARLGMLASYTPSGGTIARGALALHRLSLAGFQTRGAAMSLCVRVRQAGGDCFVRSTAGDAPVQWVARRANVQYASR